MVGRFIHKSKEKFFLSKKNFFLTKNYCPIFFSRALNLIFCPPSVLRNCCFFQILMILHLITKKDQNLINRMPKTAKFGFFLLQLTTFEPWRLSLFITKIMVAEMLSLNQLLKYWFQVRMDDFDTELENFFNSLSQEELNVIDQLDNSLSVDQAAFSVELNTQKVTNNDYCLRSSDMTSDYDIERYLHSDPENLFVEFISEEKNYGLFAKESFVKGDFIVFYRGVRLTETQYLNKLRESEVANEYIITDVKNVLFIDATDVALDSTGVARYANDEHKKPNMKAKTYIANDGSRHVQLVAIRNISEKEELVYDYGATHLPWRKTIKHQSKKIFLGSS